nr:bromodomain adjacent to zinc finger domain protein 1A-like [Aedes albopictus]
MSSREAHGSGKNVKLSKRAKSPKTKGDEVVESGDVSIVVTGAPVEISVGDRTLAGRTCKSCKGPDSDEMVQCDNCDKWHHFGCVGVTEEVADHSWSCPKCISAKWAQRSGSTSSKHLQPTGETTDAQKTSNASKEKNQQTSVVAAEKQNVNDEGQHQISDREKDNRVPASVVSSSSSRRSSRTLLKLQMQKLEEEQRLAKEFLERKYALLEEAVSERSSRSASSKVSSSMSRVRDWVRGNKTCHEEESALNYPEIFEPERHSTQNPRAADNR